MTRSQLLLYFNQFLSRLDTPCAMTCHLAIKVFFLVLSSLGNTTKSASTDIAAWKRKVGQRRATCSHMRTCLLKCLGKGRVLRQVTVTDRAARVAHGLLKVARRNLGHRVLLFNIFHFIASLSTETVTLHVTGNTLPNRQLGRTLADLRQIGTRKLICLLG